MAQGGYYSDGKYGILLVKACCLITCGELLLSCTNLPISPLKPSLSFHSRHPWVWQSRSTSLSRDEPQPPSPRQPGVDAEIFVGRKVATLSPCSRCSSSSEGCNGLQGQTVGLVRAASRRANCQLTLAQIREVMTASGLLCVGIRFIITETEGISCRKRFLKLGSSISLISL